MDLTDHANWHWLFIQYQGLVENTEKDRTKEMLTNASCVENSPQMDNVITLEAAVWCFNF